MQVESLHELLLDASANPGVKEHAVRYNHGGTSMGAFLDARHDRLQEQPRSLGALHPARIEVLDARLLGAPKWWVGEHHVYAVPSLFRDS